MQELVEGNVSLFMPMGELRAWYAAREAFLDDNETAQDKEVSQALLMTQHLSDEEQLINHNHISDWLYESARELYGRDTVDCLGDFMDWDAYENAVLMNWDTVTINGSDWWFRK